MCQAYVYYDKLLGALQVVVVPIFWLKRKEVTHGVIAAAHLVQKLLFPMIKFGA